MSGNIDLGDNDLTTVNTIDAAIIRDQSGTSVIDLADKEIVPAFTFNNNLTVEGTLTGTFSGDGSGLTNLTGYATTNELAAVSNAISTASAAAWSSFAATQVVDFADNIATNLQFIYSANGLLDLENGAYTGDFTFNDSVSIADRLVVGEFSITNIATNAFGSMQAGAFSGDATIGSASYGSVQRGFVNGTAVIGGANPTIGANQSGWFAGTASIGEFAHGAMQIGRIPPGYWATNNALSAIQIMGGDNGNYFTPTAGKGSILLGPGTNSVAYSVKAAGGFYGNAAGLTNFPSSLLRVSSANANYWRWTTAPTSSTAYGEARQMSSDGTNLYFYSVNALGAGTGRWVRVQGDASW